MDGYSELSLRPIFAPRFWNLAISVKIYLLGIIQDGMRPSSLCTHSQCSAWLQLFHTDLAFCVTTSMTSINEGRCVRAAQFID